MGRKINHVMEAGSVQRFLGLCMWGMKKRRALGIIQATLNIKP